MKNYTGYLDALLSQHYNETSIYTEDIQKPIALGLTQKAWKMSDIEHASAIQKLKDDKYVSETGTITYDGVVFYSSGGYSEAHKEKTRVRILEIRNHRLTLILAISSAILCLPVVVKFLKWISKFL